MAWAFAEAVAVYDLPAARHTAGLLVTAEASGRSGDPRIERAPLRELAMLTPSG